MRALGLLLVVPALAVVLGGCPICSTGEMTEVGGDHGGRVHAGDVLSLRARYDDWMVGPGACGGHWTVNEVEGGLAELGTVDSCGRYQAPATFPAGVTRLNIAASKYGPGCADCCPAAGIVLTVVP